MTSIGEKKTEAVNAYLIKNSKGKGEGNKKKKKKKERKKKRKNKQREWGALSQAVGRTGRSCMGV